MQPFSAPLALLAAAAACAAPAPPAAVHTSPPATATTAATAVIRNNIELAPAPAAGASTRTVVHESATTATHILRIAPGGEIAEHHHPNFTEVITLERGALSVRLNGNPVELRSGDVTVVPAGTVITGRNTHDTEARAVVVFSNVGRSGPLTVPGRPAH